MYNVIVSLYIIYVHVYTGYVATLHSTMRMMLSCFTR